MGFDADEIRERLRRYRELHRANSDPMARAALEQLIRELEEQLGQSRSSD